MDTKNFSELNPFLGPGVAFEGKIIIQEGDLRLERTETIKADIEVKTGKVLLTAVKLFEGVIRAQEICFDNGSKGKGDLIAKKITFKKSTEFDGVLNTAALVSEDGAIITGTIKRS